MRFRSIQTKQERPIQALAQREPRSHKANPQAYGLFDPDNLRVDVTFSKLLDLWSVPSVSLTLEFFC